MQPPIDRTFWNGRRVLMTGHTGFKGSWMSLWLQDLGADLTGFALNPPTDPSLFQLAGVAEGMRSLHGDLRDLETLTSALADARPEIVFHLAAQSLVRESYEHPVETFSTNVLGTVHLLEAVRHTPSVRAVVIVTTDKCYENREWLWPYRENEAMGGHDPYSSSKGCAELVTSAYRRSFFADSSTVITSARAGNVIGGGDFARDRLIPDIVRGMTRGETIHIRSPHAVRPWQHVLEPLAGYLRLAERSFQDGSKVAEAWNFGPDDSDTRTVGWIVEKMIDRWPGAQWTRDAGSHPHEAGLLKLDSSKARARLGWQPRLPLEQSLDWLIEWYRAYAADASTSKMREQTLEQIRRYEKLSRP